MYHNYPAEFPEKVVKKKDKGKTQSKLTYRDQMKTKQLFDFDGKEAEGNREDNREDCESGEQSSSEVLRKELDCADEVCCDKTFDDSYVCTKAEQADFNKEKAKLREYFKRLKVGLVEWKDVPDRYQCLLVKYYGVGREQK